MLSPLTTPRHGGWGFRPSRAGVPVSLASLAVVFPFGGLIALALAGTSWLAWVVSAVVALLVGAAAYQGAVSAAVAFDVIRSCFDNYRRTLLEQLGMPLPVSLEAERPKQMRPGLVSEPGGVG